MTGIDSIPLYGVARQYKNLREEILDATDRVLETGHVMDGVQQARFNTAMCIRTGRVHSTNVHSGTQALILALRALKNRLTVDIPRVLIPTVSFVATVNAVYEAGCEPVFCDVDANGLMDLDQVKNLDSINIIMFVNLYGNVVDCDKLQLVNQFFGRSVPTIEDAAQSFGADYKGRQSGSLATISCLSFDTTKNFNNYGNGGMVLTDDVNLNKDIMSMRDNGKQSFHTEPGTNSRMSDVDCAQMMVKLKYFATWQSRRKQIAEYYTREFANTDLQLIRYNVDVEPAYSKYVIQLDDRHALISHLNRSRIGTKITYEYSLPSLPVVRHIVNPKEYTQASRHVRRCLSLPIYPELTDAEVEYIANTVRFFQNTA